LIDTNALIGDLNASFHGGRGMDALADSPASMFRDEQTFATSEILELAGCDLLTSRAELMKQVSGSHESVAQKLNPEKSKGACVKRLELDETKIPVSRDGDRGNRGSYAVLSIVSV
jgi:hypothetical protein